MLTLRTGSKQLIRELNEAIVLNTIRTHGPLSRTDLAGLTQLSLPTVSGITASLLDAGLIYEQATGTSTGGRRPVMLALNPQAGHAVGIKLTEEAVIAALTTLDAAVVAQHHQPVVSHTPEDIAQAVSAAVDVLKASANARPIFGVGLGMAGVIDKDRRTVRYATYLGWHNLALCDLLEERLELPVVLDNDVNALTAAEHWFGAGRGVDNMVVVSLGRGVGLGMVLDGNLYRGTGGGAGEFGHTTVVPDGPRCSCGKRGCLEALVSEPALEQRISAAVGRPVSINEAINLAEQGDSTVQSIFTAAGRTLGMAIANLVNVLNPGLVIVSGEGTRAGDLVLDPLQAALREHCFNSLCDDLRVIMEPLGDDAWARGAAGLLLRELFQPALRRGDEERPSFTGRHGA